MRFEDLWDSHPTISANIFEDDAPCLKEGERAFENQCAIRMGVSLMKSGVNLDSFKGVRCWFNHKPAHILRAEELANWLKSPFFPFKSFDSFEGKSGFSRISGKKGIIFFKDYYGPSQQGDHIDLWNGSRLTKRASWFEFALRGGNHYKDATIWFWEIQ
jgi:hypothetical protein